MDSLERLNHSVEQAAAQIHALRRENRDLAKGASGAQDALRREIKRLESELEEHKAAPQRDEAAEERARQAELDAARVAEQAEHAKAVFEAEKASMLEKVASLELRLMHAEREEVMPTASPAEWHELRQQLNQMQLELGEREQDLERAKGAFTAMQVKLAESAGPDEVARWQARMHELEVLVKELEPLRLAKDQIEIEKLEIKKQKKMLAAIKKERDMTRSRLAEIKATLESVRLS